MKNNIFAVYDYGRNVINAAKIFYDNFNTSIDHEVIYQCNNLDEDSQNEIHNKFKNILEKLNLNILIFSSISQNFNKFNNDNIDQYPKDLDNDVQTIFYCLNDKNFLIEYKKSGSFDSINIKIYYSNDSYTEFRENLIKDIKDIFPKESKERPNKFNIICKNGGGLYLKEFDLKSKNEFSFDFFDFYNEDFIEVSNQIIDKIKNDSKGIVLLHGEPGTGKTSYLRYIIQNIGNKKIIYLPPDMVTEIASPDFFSFLMENPNSLLMIEDAETVLKTREAGINQAVSNILNVSDGLLGNALNYQILATFNSKIHDIDEALLRPGRLIAEYKFNKLSINRSNDLIKKIHKSNNLETNKELNLAEIFNFNTKLYKEKVIEKQSIGFI